MSPGVCTYDDSLAPFAIGRKNELVEDALSDLEFSGFGMLVLSVIHGDVGTLLADFNFSGASLSLGLGSFLVMVRWVRSARGGLDCFDSFRIPSIAGRSSQHGPHTDSSPPITKHYDMLVRPGVDSNPCGKNPAIFQGHFSICFLSSKGFGHYLLPYLNDRFLAVLPLQSEVSGSSISSYLASIHVLRC